VQSLEDERIVVTDLSGQGRVNEALVTDEEDGRLVDTFCNNSIDLVGQQA
jgi:hypothetical protein